MALGVLDAIGELRGRIEAEMFRDRVRFCGYAPRVMYQRHLLECDRGRRLTAGEIANLRRWFHESGRDPNARVFVVLADDVFCELNELPAYVHDYPVFVVDAASSPVREKAV